ncbi:hypothetical protein MTBBW1_1890020 [Desulfamplus magnetovallimortis]|uniref:Uncharacterized protein n=1 Tax=Desulfamplus magnetovallimortis TaxID=1246637 RepID=A0A1W1HB28_9BACT|nr:hypothetical protein MTBBW1_1890020 [Desulfamplus magnetovallimortis]
MRLPMSERDAFYATKQLNNTKLIVFILNDYLIKGVINQDL